MASLEQLRTAVLELRQEAQRQRDVIQAQQDEIELLKQPRPQTSSAKPKPSLPDPEKFNGQAYRYDTWLPSIQAKLRVDGDAIGDSTAQFYYVYLNLDTQVQAMVLPQLSQAEDDQKWDYHTILGQLSRVYDNPHKVQEAEDRLYTLRQGTDSLHVYVAKFERTLYEARGQEWNDVNKISALRQGLSSTIRQRLAQQLNLPRTYTGFLQTVQLLAGRSSSTPHGHTHEHIAPAIRQSYTPKPDTDRMDLNTIDIGAITIGQQARSSSPAERQRLRQEGKCVRCGSQDHWVKDCPIQPFSSSGKKMTIAALDDSSYNDYADLLAESAELGILDQAYKILQA
jgi:hypothetical protein